MNILIVEDSEDLANNIREILAIIRTRRPNATITIAPNFDAGAKFMAAAIKPDIVFLDLQLPGSGWRQTLESIGTFETEVSKVIIITGYPPEIVRNYLSQHPDIEILHKVEGFFDKILGAIFRALQRNKGGNLEQVSENIRIMRELTAPNATQ